MKKLVIIKFKDIEKAGFILSSFFGFVCSFLFSLIWHEKIKLFFNSDFQVSWFIIWFILFVIICIVGAIVHELIHGVSFAINCRNHFKSIRFGIKIRPFPHLYTSCREPLSKLAYLFGVVMPLLILGIAPAIYGLSFGSFTHTLFGFIFSCVSVGDIMLIYKVLKHVKKELVYDLPEEVGFEYF